MDVEHVYERKSRYYDTEISVVHQRGRGIAWRIWPSAHVLIDWLEDNEKKWLRRSLHCIEIGAGVGMVGLAAASFGAARVTITDLPETLPAIQRSVDLNAVQVRSKISVASLCYGDRHDIDNIMASVDRKGKLVILASDIIYWESLFVPIAETLDSFINKHNASAAYIGYRKRDWKIEKRFFTKILSQHNLECLVVFEGFVDEEDGASQSTAGSVVYSHEKNTSHESTWNMRIYKIHRNTNAS